MPASSVSICSIVCTASSALCREQKYAAMLEDVNRRYRQGTREHEQAVQRAQAVAAQAAGKDQQAEELLRKAMDTGTQCLLSLLVQLPNSRRAEREADLVRPCSLQVVNMPCMI
jgi:hypothetical protein